MTMNALQKAQELSRRWRGGVWLLHFNGRDWHRVFGLSNRSHNEKWCIQINSSRNRGRYFTYPGLGRKPRMRVYAKFEPMSIETYAKVMAKRSIELFDYA